MKFASRILPLLLLGYGFAVVAGENNTDSLLQKLNTSGEDTSRVLILVNLAKEYIASDSVKYSKYIEEALALSRKLNYIEGEVQCLRMNGNRYFIDSHYSKALDNNLKVLKLEEQRGNKKGISRVLRNIGSIYTNTGDFPTALAYYNKALKIAEAIPESRDLASLLANIAIVYQQTHNFGKALEYNMKALEVTDKLKDEQTRAYVLNSLGSLYFTMGKQDENSEELSKAIKYLREALLLKEASGDKKSIANTLGNLGDVYMETGDFKKALEYYGRGMAYARETGFKKWLQEGYGKMADLYGRTGDYKNAYEYQVRFMNLRDTMQGMETMRSMEELESRFKIEKKDREIQLLSKDNELKETRLSRQRFVIAGGIIGLAIVLAFAFFIYRGYKEKKKVNLVIEEKNRSITDSIRYAKRIQTAILPSEEVIGKNLQEYFVLYKPKDIVSGDFYFCANAGNKVIIGVADCTGHGVPGAFMSMIGNSLLNQIIKENNIHTPSEILNQLHSGVREALKQYDSDSDTRDGMDIAICTIDRQNKKLEYAGANRSMCLVKKQGTQSSLSAGIAVWTELTEIKADKFAIGGIQSEDLRKFTNHAIPYESGDLIYLSTDGYADQFGGSEGKKFRTKRLKELFVQLAPLEMHQQREKMEKAFSEWMRDSEQVDDVLVMGIRL
jgi:serine phosphatase RsbU (regulator of sigma subunit)/tetratricopeptide (TPR) repeat protein